MPKNSWTAIDKDRAKFGRQKGKTDEITETFATGELSDVGQAKAWQVDIDEIQPREVNEFHQVNNSTLKESIKMVGIVHPIALLDKGMDEQGKRYVIISGHRRFEAVCELHTEYPDDIRFQTIPATIYSDLDEQTEEQIYKDANLESRNINFEDALQHIDYLMDKIESDPAFEERLRLQGQSKQGVHRLDQRINSSYVISDILTNDLGFDGFSKTTVWRILQIKKKEAELGVPSGKSLLKQVGKGMTIKEIFNIYYPSKNTSRKSVRKISYATIKTDLDKITDSIRQGNYKEAGGVSLSDVLKSIENLEKEVLKVKQNSFMENK